MQFSRIIYTKKQIFYKMNWIECFEYNTVILDVYQTRRQKQKGCM